MKLRLYPEIYFTELGVVLLGWSFLNFRWLDYLIRFQGSYALTSILLSAGIIFWLKKIKKDEQPLFFLDEEYFLEFILWIGVAMALIPLGLVVGLLTFSLNWYLVFIIPAVFIGILLTVGLVEELVFRQVVLVFMEQRWGISIAIVGSSMLFGFSHIVRGSFPNWSYVFLATMAGLLYGYVFKKYGLTYVIFLHSLVDTVRFALFS